MDFFQQFCNLLVISVVSEPLRVHSEVTDFIYLLQNNIFSLNLEEEHTEVPNPCGTHRNYQSF